MIELYATHATVTRAMQPLSTFCYFAFICYHWCGRILWL